MKTIGMIAGLSPESSAHYYAIMNEFVRDKLGGNHSAKILMLSVDFQEVVDAMDINDWNTVQKIMIREARVLQPHVDAIIICTNTVHKVARDVEQAISVPLLHIGKVTANRVWNTGIRKVGLLGTSPTMQEGFIKDFFFMDGIDTIVPAEEEMEFMDTLIFQELCRGVINPESKKRLLSIISNLELRGAKGIVLACTELQMIIKPEDLKIPVFDTMRIHAEAAAEFILEK